MSDRSTLLTTTRDTLADHIRAGNELDAYATFARLVYIAHATEGCEAQGVPLGDLPRLVDVVARAADALATVTRERDEARAALDQEREKHIQTMKDLVSARCSVDILDETVAGLKAQRDELRAVGRRLLRAYNGSYFVREVTHPWESPMVRQDHACHECASDAEPGWRCPYHELRALLGDDAALAGAKS